MPFGTFATLLLVFIFAAPRVSAQPAFDLGSGVKLQADRVEFLQDQGLILAQGNVHVQQEGIHLYADTLRFDLTSQQLIADGHVTWQQDGQEVQASKITYNLGTHRGHANEVRTTTPPWYFTGTDVDLEPGLIRLRKARFTTCDYPTGYEHYHLSAGTILIRTGKSLSARNVVLYMGKVPVFYIPYFAKNLKDIRVPFQFDTGSSTYLGRYALITVNYLFSPTNYGSAYLDYFQKKGLGFGVRHEIELNKNSVLSLYGYWVREKDTHQTRWEGRVRNLWAVSSKLQGRVELDVPGDGLFSRDYSIARRDPSLVSSFRQYDTSMTWNPRGFTLGVLLRRQETASYTSLTQTVFDKSYLAAPQANFSLFPFTILGSKGPRADLSSNFTRQWLLANGYYQLIGSAEGGISQTVNLRKSQSLYGRVALQENYLSKSDLGADNHGDQRHMTGQATWTSRWQTFLTTTFGFNFARALSHLLPTETPHHGVTQKQLTASLEYNAMPLFLSRTSTTYDFLAQTDHNNQRFSLLREELTVTPSKTFNLATVANFSIVAKDLTDLNQIMTLRSPKDMWRISLSANYVNPDVSSQGVTASGLDRQLNITTDMSFVLFTNYRLSVLESYDLERAVFVNRQVSLYRDLHDWEAQFSYSQTEGSGSQVSFRLNLKAFPGRPLTVSKEQFDQWSGMSKQSAGELSQTAASEFQ